MTRPDELPPLTEAQLEVMNLVWEHGEMTVAGLWKALAARRPLARNTVLTTLTRLAEKGWLVQRAEGNVFHYSAAVPRDETVSGMVSRLVDTVFSGSAEGLVLALLDGRGLTEDEAKRIRALIAKAEKKS